jgi:putative acetyltransferase
MIIRKETEKDFSQIYDLVKTAFQTAKVSDGKEQDFVNQRRSSSNYIPELALIAEENDTMVGHIMLTKTDIINGGSKFETLLLAPIAVVLEYRNTGIGAKLINESFRLAKAMGYTSVFLVGDPGYYHRFGFKASVEFGITQLHNIPDEYVLAYELVPNALLGTSGIIDWQ